MLSLRLIHFYKDKLSGALAPVNQCSISHLDLAFQDTIKALLACLPRFPGVLPTEYRVVEWSCSSQQNALDRGAVLKLP